MQVKHPLSASVEFFIRAGIFFLCFTTIRNGYAQFVTKDSAFQISAYAEVYYLYDFGKPPNHNRPDFLYSFNRANEFNLNIGVVKAAYASEKVRGNLALMAGTYTNANLANEPGALKQIFEANAGVKISGKKNLWVDAGIFASHIGFEGVIGSACWNMGRSLQAENSPYYETGAKITYISDNEKWLVSGLLLNGWQRITRVNGNSLPSFGHQVTYTPNQYFRVNSSSFIGTDDPDSTRRMRYFHNLFLETTLSEKLALIAGLDMGIQQKNKASKHYESWYAPILIMRFTPHEKWAFAARAEYYADKGEVIVAAPVDNGFRTSGFSFNADRWITSKVCWRMEARLFKSPDDIYLKEGKPVSTNFALGSSLCISF